MRETESLLEAAKLVIVGFRCAQKSCPANLRRCIVMELIPAIEEEEARHRAIEAAVKRIHDENTPQKPDGVY